jgi:4-amino-4-deoxy-L-arabinose transferase-like glycosyltransferase
MFHPEPLDLLAVTASLYLGARLLRRAHPPLRDAALLGLVLGLSLLVRQFAAYGVGAVGLALLVARHYRALAVAAGVAVLVAAPWYVRQAIRYSNPVFAETPTVQKPIYRRRPASFYLDPGLPQVFSAPWRPHFVNRAVPTTYSELWGDYFGVWVWRGKGEPEATPRRQLRLQNAIGLLPTLLALGGWIALLRARGRSLLVALVPLLGFVGYAYFTVGYPTRDGDVLKASYMLTTATAWALAFGYAVDRLARRRAVAWALAALLAVCALVEVPFLLY